MPRRSDATATWFHTPLGSVRYGAAKTNDACGSELATTTRPIDQAIEFFVPAEEVARARGDITIDPIISSEVVNPSTLDDHDPDVAYDAASDRYFIAYEQVFSQTDHDAYCMMLAGATGLPIPDTAMYIDSTTDDWRQVSVGNLAAAHQFLAAASVGPGMQKIRCRTRPAASNTMGPQFTISTNAPPCNGCHFARNLSPVVGGDTEPTSTGTSGRYCVAWIWDGIDDNLDLASSSPFVAWCTVGGDGSSTVPQTLEELSQTDVDPTTYPMLAISKSDGDAASGASQDWNLVWHSSQIVWQFQNYSVSAENIRLARIHANGAVSFWPTTVVLFGSSSQVGAGALTGPYHSISVSTSESGHERRFLLTFDAIVTSGLPRLFGAVIDPTLLVPGVAPNPTIYDLTHLEELKAGGSSTFVQWRPSVDCDGTSFVVSFIAASGGIVGLGAAEFSFVPVSPWSHVTSFQCTEPQVEVAQNSFAVGPPRCCAEASGGGTRRNTLMATTIWSQSPPNGNPFVALHSHN